MASDIDPHFKSLKFLPSSQRSAVYTSLTIICASITVEDDTQCSPMKRRKVSSPFDFNDTSDSNGFSPDDTNEAETEVATYRAEQVVPD